MSWSCSFIGKPDGIVKALFDLSAKLKDQSKVEFDDALPHLTALVQQNFNINGPIRCTYRLHANGHGSVRNGVEQDRCLSVTLETIHGVVAPDPVRAPDAVPAS